MTYHKYLFLLVVLMGCQRASVHQIEYKSIGILSQTYQMNATIDYYFQQTKDVGNAIEDYSFVSEHQKLISTHTSNTQKNKISDELLSKIKNKYKPHNAIDFIVSESEKYEILMLNEHHKIPKHRNFLTQLLPGLYKKGYRNIGLEGLSNYPHHEKAIKENGYPTPENGPYLKEPEFANLIRKAHDLGFEIFGYGGSGEDGSAKNILEHMGSSSGKGKTIILCGWDHIKEGPTGTYWEYAIAGRIKEFSGMDPLTINQTQYFERAERKYEDSLYQALDYDEPTVLLDENNESIDLEHDPGWYDLFVFHPRTKFTEGIPDWILKDKSIQEFEIPEMDINCPCKVMLFEEGDEVIKAVPTYMVEIKRLEDSVKMPVSKDVKYKLLVANEKTAFTVE